MTGVNWLGCLTIMASRQEEKQRLREERLAQEEADKRAAARSQRLRVVGGGLVALLIIAGVVFAIINGSDGGPGGDADGPRTAADASKVELPTPETTNLEGAAKTAGCKVEHPAFEGDRHVDKAFTGADYKSNPPTSGDHYPPPAADDGIYDPGNSPELGTLVHSLEHGRIHVQYKGLTPGQVDQLEAFLAEKTGYHLVLSENTTDMPYAVAATAWTHLVGCETFSPKVFDVLRTFYMEYVDKGPENVP